MSISQHQLVVIEECLKKGGGCLSLPMGSGKTIISIITAVNQTLKMVPPKKDSKEEKSIEELPPSILIVVSKTLLGNWISEIQKFYGNTLPFEVLHKEYLKSRLPIWQRNPLTRIVLTTSEVISKAFTSYQIDNQSIVHEEFNAMIDIVHYVSPQEPLLKANVSDANIYSTKWGALIVDEIQNYTNIETIKCRALGAICARYRWGLSGTAFPEPKPERILGYYYILNIQGPRSLPDMKEYLRSAEFQGLSQTMVVRETNPDFEIPEIVEEIVSHELSTEEAKIYTTMKTIMKSLKTTAEEFKAQGDTENSRRFSSYCLALITYFRQGLVCSIIPIASAAVDITDYKSKSQLSRTLLDEIQKLELTEWLNNPLSICSTRIQHILKKIAEHKNERILLFSCYKSCLDIIRCYLGGYNVLTLEANMTMNQRQQMVQQFAQLPHGILCLSFQLGSVGLNLQMASTVILTDMAWNRDTSKQAAARILRFGQLAKKIHVIMFTSNTAIEKAIILKQKSKLEVYGDLKTGATEKKIEKINMKEIMKIIELEENEELLEELINLKV